MKARDLIQSQEMPPGKPSRRRLAEQIMKIEWILDALIEEVEKNGLVLECTTRGYGFVKKPIFPDPSP